MAVQYAFGKIVTQGLDLNVDAADPTSYPGTGTSWTSVVNRSITGSLVSCSFSSDFKGGIVFNNPSASVVFPGTVANYGPGSSDLGPAGAIIADDSGSFTIELAFRPSQIQGIHYLVSKNSGSFPNWGVYLSGSGGSGKLWASYNISAAISCSVSSSTVFTTGSTYFTDTSFDPLGRRIYINVNGVYDAISTIGNNTGSLSTTGSLFIGNTSPSSSQAYSGSIFNTKVYEGVFQGFTNYRSISQRLQKVPPVRPLNALALIVAGGGSGGDSIAGGGGAGGLILTEIPLTPNTYTVTVGAGGINANGQNSSFGSYVAIGGGKGGNFTANGNTGGSGGGGGWQGSGGAGTAGQGNNGGNNGSGGGSGGGGGAGNAAAVGSTPPGGNGLYFALFDNLGLGFPSGWFAGGGGGIRDSGTDTQGGLGGGGRGATGTGAVDGTAGIANTGGGGGGGQRNLVVNGKRGGSGIVIIRYPGPPIATGGTITSVGGDTIHTFTATGSHTFTVF
jgi:hypothetical protein